MRFPALCHHVVHSFALGLPVLGASTLSSSLRRLLALHLSVLCSLAMHLGASLVWLMVIICVGISIGIFSLKAATPSFPLYVAPADSLEQSTFTLTPDSTDVPTSTTFPNSTAVLRSTDASDTTIASDSISSSFTPPRSVLYVDTSVSSERPYRYTFDGSPTRKTTQIDVGKALLYGGGYTAAVGAAQFYQYQLYWKNRVSFRIIDDNDLEFGADKGGHLFAGYFMSKFSTDVLLTAGVGEDLATIGGGLMGLGYQFFVEVQDGYGYGWGFSPSDMIANTLGAGLHIAQRYVPGAKYIKMKAEFYPSPWIGEKMRKGASSPIDDYSAWTWWLSLDVHGILPEPAKAFWPSWLNLAFGYAARNLEWEGEQSRRFIISLDYDLEKLLPDGAPFWNWLRQYLNLLKFPAPAIEFGFLDDGKGLRTPLPVKAYIVFPFKIASF